jgi:hypothetical protein
VNLNTSHKPAKFFHVEVFKVKQYELIHKQTLQMVSKRSIHNNRTAKTTFLKPVKYAVKQILSLYYKYKPEVQLITCVTRHFSKLLQQLGDQGMKASAKTGSHLGNKTYNTSQMTNQLIRGLKTTHVSTPYAHVQYSRMNNFKQCSNNATAKNMESLERIFYQVARECLMAAVDLLPGLGSLLYGIYSVRNWSVQMTELVNRNQLALCTKKFIEKKFWDWIETEI